ncbi:hypothetical protein AB4143_05835 [Vibrio breoganii]
MNTKTLKLSLAITLSLILSACGGDDNNSPTSSSLPKSGEITTEELFASSVSQDGYDSITISSDSSVTLKTDELTLSNNIDGEPQKLTIIGNLTIKK